MCFNPGVSEQDLKVMVRFFHKIKKTDRLRTTEELVKSNPEDRNLRGALTTVPISVWFV